MGKKKFRCTKCVKNFDTTERRKRKLTVVWEEQLTEYLHNSSGPLSTDTSFTHEYSIGYNIIINMRLYTTDSAKFICTAYHFQITYSLLLYCTLLYLFSVVTLISVFLLFLLACKKSKKCKKKGGSCQQNTANCSGTVNAKLCKGKKCVCCISKYSLIKGK